MSTNEFSLAELLIVAAAEAWRDDKELLATGIGPIPRFAVGLAKKTFAPDLYMTDGEAMLVKEPLPSGPRGDIRPLYTGWMSYHRVFETAWKGTRHAMVTPVQIDRYAQTNISALGPDFRKPKVQMLGVRGLPGNSISHKNSIFVPNHSKRSFVEGEVDVVSSVGFNKKTWPAGAPGDFVKIGLVVTNLCVLDFNGPDHAARVLSVHPGVSFQEVQDATGFELLAADGMKETPVPTAEQLEIIRGLDPVGLRASVLKGNPAGVRQAA